MMTIANNKKIIMSYFFYCALLSSALTYSNYQLFMSYYYSLTIYELLFSTFLHTHAHTHTHASGCVHALTHARTYTASTSLRLSGLLRVSLKPFP